MTRPSFIAFGLNHESASVDVREAFDLTDDAVLEVYRSFRIPDGSEWILLTTCNRAEAWMYGSRSDMKEIEAVLQQHVGSWPSAYEFLFEGGEALQHVMEVVSGLRSQIMGDSQILSQVKSAYRLADEGGAVGPRMHRLMHVALATAKQVINTTALASGTPSVAKAAVQTLRDRLETEKRVIDDLTVLVVGCGVMGATVLRELAADSPRECYVTNRTRQRAEKIAGKYGVTVVPWSRRHRAMARADVVIVTTGAPNYVVQASEVEMSPPNGSTLMVDISVPRNVDPAISDYPGYQVLNIDQLSQSAKDAHAALCGDYETARQICAKAVEKTLLWDDQWVAVEPAARVLLDAFESVRRQEVERNLHRFPQRHHQQVERLTRSIMQKMMAVPIVRLKKMANGDSDLTQRLELLIDLFNRDNCEE